jgi:hypothetical protein
MTATGGRFIDSNQIEIKDSTNELFVQVFFDNTIMARINITKTNRGNEDDNGITYHYSKNLGYTIINTKNYNTGKQWEIKYVMREIFQTFGF